MRFVKLLVALSLAMPLSSIYANEANSDEDNAKAYCNEQLQLSGIEDSAEKEEYLKECNNSFSAPAGTNQSAE